MRETILTDVDGVLLNWLDPFLEFMDTRKERKVGEQHLDFHKLENLYVDTDHHDIDAAIEEFNNSDNFGKLPSIKKADLNVNQLYCAGFDIVAITSSNTNNRSTKLRTHNLIDLYGGIFQDIIFVERRQSKQDILAEFMPSYWVEDHYPNAIHGVEVGHQAIVIKHIYNRKHWDSPIVDWVEDWSEIFRKVM